MKIAYLCVLVFFTSSLYSSEPISCRSFVFITDTDMDDNSESIKVYYKKELVGFIQYSYCTAKKTAFIDSLRVYQQFQRKGIGSKLVNDIKSQLKERAIKEIIFYADVNAISFYKNQGAQVLQQDEMDLLIGGNALMKIDLQ